MKDYKKWCEKLDKFFEDLFIKKAPSLSQKAKGWIVKAAPYLALIFGVIAVPGLIAVLGIGTITAPFWALTGSRSLGHLIVFFIGAAQVVLELMAVSPLFKKKKRGWELMFKATLLSVVSAILSFSGFGVVMAMVSLYLLYQVKSYYK
jgi:hypothetical protein